MKVYGWTELNGCSYGIECRNMNEGDFEYIDESQEVHTDLREYHNEDGDGRWFKTFSAAKKAAIHFFKEGIDWRKDAIREIQSLKKFNATTVS